MYPYNIITKKNLEKINENNRVLAAEAQKYRRLSLHNSEKNNTIEQSENMQQNIKDNIQNNSIVIPNNTTQPSTKTTTPSGIQRTHQNNSTVIPNNTWPSQQDTAPARPEQVEENVSVPNNTNTMPQQQNRTPNGGNVSVPNNTNTMPQQQNRTPNGGNVVVPNNTNTMPQQQNRTPNGGNVSVPNNTNTMPQQQNRTPNGGNVSVPNNTNTMPQQQNRTPNGGNVSVPNNTNTMPQQQNTAPNEQRPGGNVVLPSNILDISKQNMVNETVNQEEIDEFKEQVQQEVEESLENITQQVEGDEIDERVLDMIAMAVASSDMAARYYLDLMYRITDHQEREIMREIYSDEIKFQKFLNEIYRQFTGTDAPPIVLDERSPSGSLLADMTTAMNNKIGDFDFFRDIYFAIDNPEFRDILFEILTDEQINISRLIYLIINHSNNS